jgi:uncharacterized protein (TIGR03083 family)
MLQKPAPILVANQFPALLEALLGLLETLAPEDWERPTAAEGWCVRDIGLHLLGDDIGYLSNKRDGFREKTGRLDTWEDLVAFINQRNGLWVEAARRTSPRLLIELLRFTGQQFNAFVLTLDPNAPGSAVSWAGPERAPVWLDLAREFTERWHHQQHIREAAGRPGLTGAEFLGPILATFVFALPQTYRQVVAAEGTWVSLTITGAAGGVWSVRREGERWQLYTGRPADSRAEVILPEDTAWRLFTKGISKEEARAQALLKGDPALAERMLETISIIA